MDHPYMRPPPPPYAPPATADPYQRPPPHFPPPPSNQPWTYPTTQPFQYQHQSQHSLSPPPQQWVTPSASSDHIVYPPHPPPYSSHQLSPYPGNPHYPPPRPQHVPQSYTQDWGTRSWSHHQNWECSNQYAAANNGEDWAAKAKAWAAKTVTDSQHPQSQPGAAGRPGEQNHFHVQYSQPIDPQLLEVPRPLAPVSSYQQYPLVTGPPSRLGIGQLPPPEAQYTSSGQLSNAVNMLVPYATRDGSFAGGSISMYHQQEKSSISSSIHQQEVPSSYSSVPGNDLHVTSTLQHHVQPLPPGGGRPGWTEEPHRLFGSPPAETVTDQSDRSLNFAPHFNRHLDPHAQTSYSHSSGLVYPSVPQKIQSGPQLDLPIAMRPPASGHSMPIFPTVAGFHPTFPMGSATFGVGSGVATQSTAFPGDVYGVSERPKKASVPNWLREEIIKNKAVIPSSAPEIPKEDSQSIEEDDDKFSRKGDQADSRSMESFRSAEDDNDDEEEVEATRTAAINQEIKRILTEVLLKVTDELFDEIATKVLKEDDLSVEVATDTDMSNHQILPFTQATLTPKASAKILIPTNAQKVEFDDAGEKSVSAPRGDILGLAANYASDEEDEEIQSSEKLNSKESSSHLQSSSIKDFEDHPVVQNGGPREVTEDQSHIYAKLESNGTGIKSTDVAAANSSTENSELNDIRAAGELVPSGIQHSPKRPPHSTEDELQHGSDSSKSDESVIENVDRTESSGINLDAIRSVNDYSQSHNTGNRSDKNDRHEKDNSSIGKDHKDLEKAKERVDKKGDRESRRHEERHAIAEKKKDYDNGSKDKENDKGKTYEKSKDYISRKRPSPSDGKGGASHTGKDKRHRGKEDSDEKRQDKTRDEKKERSRDKSGSGSSRYKRHRSPSVGARGRKDKSKISHVNDRSDESSNDSKRKLHRTGRHKSPSPIRSRKRQVSRSPHSKHSKRRQVSRSPHSKHSKRRHSPYSSHETIRGKKPELRLRSKSPVHRR